MSEPSGKGAGEADASVQGPAGAELAEGSPGGRRGWSDPSRRVELGMDVALGARAGVGRGGWSKLGRSESPLRQGQAEVAIFNPSHLTAHIN